MNGMSRVLLIAIVVLCGAAISADAGWVLYEASGDDVYISKGKMRSDWDRGAIVIDGTSGMIYFFNDARKVYVSGTSDEICADMEKMMETMMEGIPEEQREMMMKMVGEENAPKVEIVDKGAGEKVAGFATIRFDVMADGELYEEIWITNDEKLMKDCGEIVKILGKFSKCMESMSAMAGAPSPEGSEAYLGLFDKGMMVKTVSHGDEDSDSPMNVESIVEEDIPDAKFAVPEGYEKISFPAMFGM